MSTVTDLREKSKAEGAGSTMHQDSAHATPVTIRKKPIIGILQVTAIIVLLGLAFFYSRAPDQTAAQLAAQLATKEPAQENPSVAGTQAPLVSILKPIASAQQVAITSTGSVAVRSYVTLTPQVSGKVVATSSALRSGGRFSAGETLVQLEQRDFTLALAQAQADVASADASLQLSLAEGSAAVSNYRLINPVKKAPPLVAKAPQIAQARAQLQSAIARRDIQQTNLERSVFSLPFAGRVVESSADEGQILSVGQSFGRVYALDAVEIVIALAPEKLAKIAPAENRVVTITADGRTFVGRVDRVAAERDSRSRFSQVFITIDDNQSLTPGTFVSVTIDGPIVDDTIAEVSATILSRSDEAYLVKAFDYDQGIIMGAVPGASAGLAVRLAGT
jgi:RND family efflux transporter MFP subunit